MFIHAVQVEEQGVTTTHLLREGEGGVEKHCPQVHLLVLIHAMQCRVQKEAGIRYTR